eukprot:2085010-Pleurochrysis_carterae.AAC.4
MPAGAVWEAAGVGCSGMDGAGGAADAWRGPLARLSSPAACVPFLPRPARAPSPRPCASVTLLARGAAAWSLSCVMTAEVELSHAPSQLPTD